jgi:iron complex outermembrane recepter protein
MCIGGTFAALHHSLEGKTMLKRTKLSLAVGAAFSAGLVGFTPVAVAQSTMDRVEITGSLIKRIEGETSLPVTTLSISDLEKAGVTNAEQAVKFITQQQGGTVTSGSVSGTNGAASYADLRSLGANRTLVLLNGRRVVQNPFSVTAVDLNTLPTSSLERIEVLADGASATYGTDAIAGVINFITLKEYQGVTIGGEMQLPEQGGGEIYLANLLGGYGNLATQGWNVYGGLNYRKQQPLNGTERDFMQSSWIPSHGFNGLSPTTFPANYSQTVGTTTTVSNTNPSLPNCFPPTSLATPLPIGLGPTRCGADTQSWTNVIPEQEQWSAFLKGSLALGSNNTLTGEYFYSRNTVTTQIAPSPEGGLTMTPLSPYYPGNGITPITNAGLNPTQNISVAWRTTALGPRQGEQVNDTQRFVLGLDGNGAGWDYNVTALWSNAEVVNTFLNGYPKTQPLRDGVRGVNGAPYLNPFGSQSTAGLAYMQANTVLGEVQNGNATLWQVAGVGSTQFGKLQGGPMSLALAAEFRAEEMVYNTNVPLVSQAASSGLAGSGAVREGDRNIWAVAAEMNFPVLKNMDIGVAIRYDDYSDFGGTTNPKVSIRYTPIEILLLRASYNTGFAAPSLYNLYLPNSTTFTATRYNDPVLCPNGVPNSAMGAVPSRDCGIQFQQLQGGSATLQPEKSDAWTVGFVLQATPEISFGLDYWNYHITDSISVIGDQAIFADPNKYANLYVRCSQASAAQQNAIGACQTPGGDPLAYVINTFQNLGDVKTQGIDGQFNWTGGANEWGRLTLGVRGTYVLKYEFQVEPNGQWYNPVGNYNAQFAGPVIRYQQITNFGWQYQAWSVNLFNRYMTGYYDQNGVIAPYNQNTVGASSIWNLSATWTGYKGLTLQAGVLNLFDTDPSFTNQLSRFQARAYDDRFSNPLGRTWTLAAKYSFF